MPWTHRIPSEAPGFTQDQYTCSTASQSLVDDDGDDVGGDATTTVIAVRLTALMAFRFTADGNHGGGGSGGDSAVMVMVPVMMLTMLVTTCETFHSGFRDGDDY